MAIHERAKQQGFTLIELMIVVAIMGILVGSAVPTYQEFMVRARVGEGLELAAPAKAAVADYYMTEKAFPTSNALAGLPVATQISGDAVTSVTVSTGGGIYILYNAKVGAGTMRLRLVPSVVAGSIKWTCSRYNGFTVNQVPKMCR